MIATTPPRRQRRPADSWTPSRLATRWGVSIDKPLAWIRAGQLHAINIASKQTGKPRWIVTPEALAVFEAARSSTATVAVRPIRRRRQTAGVIEYFT
jgi:hypothetical protein